MMLLQEYKGEQEMEYSYRLEVAIKYLILNLTTPLPSNQLHFSVGLLSIFFFPGMGRGVRSFREPWT